MKKKRVTLLAVVCMMCSVLAFNYVELKENRTFTDLSSVASISYAQAEGGRKCYTCDWDNPDHQGIPFWDRICYSCSIRFNNFYGNTGYCWK